MVVVPVVRYVVGFFVVSVMTELVVFEPVMVSLAVPTLVL
jgi:hypothetical protein